MRWYIQLGILLVLTLTFSLSEGANEAEPKDPASEKEVDTNSAEWKQQQEEEKKKKDAEDAKRAAEEAEEKKRTSEFYWLVALGVVIGIVAAVLIGIGICYWAGIGLGRKKLAPVRPDPEARPMVEVPAGLVRSVIKSEPVEPILPTESRKSLIAAPRRKSMIAPSGRKSLIATPGRKSIIAIPEGMRISLPGFRAEEPPDDPPVTSQTAMDAKKSPRKSIRN